MYERVPLLFSIMNQHKQWADKVNEISRIHERKCIENPGWTLDDTRRITGYSLGYISESLKLARAFNEHPKLAECADRETALDKLRPARENFPNGTKVLVKFGNTFEQGIVVGRGTMIPRDTVWIIQLDHPFLFERVSKRMFLVIAKASELRELDV